jgi:hypothetical protein
VLAHLLPGFREIRAPLASGYIWLLSLWIALADHIPNKKEAQGVWESAYHLSAIAGTTATLAAATFAAYLIGSLLEIRARSIVHWFRFSEWWWSLSRKTLKKGDFSDPRMLRWTSTSTTARGPANLHEPVGHYDSLTALRRPEWGSRASRSALIDLAVYIGHVGGPMVATPFVIGRFGDELDQLAIRLQAKNADLYSTYDRATAEADLRVNVGFSLSCFMAVIAGKSSPSFLLLIPCACLLIVRGQQKAREANDVLIQAVVSGELQSTVLTSSLPQFARSLESPEEVRPTEGASDTPASADAPGSPT